ncbi:MAG TPA: hypothetical protein VE441_03330, partial [Mycobacterium sp.]|nr:hypothetical protein [Mycobacterium sp.]
VDAARAGLAASPYSTITVITDCPVQITLYRLPPATVARIDGAFTDTTVAVPHGRHRITLAAAGATARRAPER